MRLFTAIELPAPVQSALAGVLDTLRLQPRLKDAVSWSKPHNVHVTLKFLGDLPDDCLPHLSRALALIPVPAMSFKIDRFLVFPGNGPARVLAANVNGDVNPLVALFNHIEPTVQPLGVGRDAREFKPHVTLGRFRRPSLKLTAMSLIRLIDPGLVTAIPPFTATEFSLIQSRLEPTGPAYTTLARFGTPPASPP